VKVLLAHTSRTVREQAAELFEGLGWDCLQTGDALEALRLCRAGHPDVAVLDADLEWHGEGTLHEHFRSDTELRRIRLLVLTKEVDLGTALAVIEDGLEFVPSPVSPAALALRVKAVERMHALEARLDDQRTEMRVLIHADPLTGLLDRRFTTRQLGAQLNAARRHGQPLAVLLVDLDRLKPINDELGHAAGDTALKAVAQVLEERLRDTDIAGRWGGDEFLVILPATRADDAMTVARDLVSSVAELQDVPVPLSLSIGCAEWQEEDQAELLERADRALYEAKGAGRNRVEQAAPRKLEIAVPDATETVDGRGLRVLLVDDVDTIRDLLRLTLEGVGAEIVGEATNGREAVDVAKHTHPDLVVIDWNMPVVDGIQGTRALVEAMPGITVVAFTSTDDPRIHRALLEAGAVANFNKADLGPLLEFVARQPSHTAVRPG
jgi:diguanylate cyclase (GGDEF)-like protein